MGWQDCGDYFQSMQYLALLELLAEVVLQKGELNKQQSHLVLRIKRPPLTTESKKMSVTVIEDPTTNEIIVSVEAPY